MRSKHTTPTAEHRRASLSVFFSKKEQGGGGNTQTRSGLILFYLAVREPGVVEPSAVAGVVHYDSDVQIRGQGDRGWLQRDPPHTRGRKVAKGAVLIWGVRNLTHSHQISSTQSVTQLFSYPPSVTRSHPHSQ